jgi:hypothetical protein
VARCRVGKATPSLKVALSAANHHSLRAFGKSLRQHGRCDVIRPISLPREGLSEA